MYALVFKVVLQGCPVHRSMGAGIVLVGVPIYLQTFSNHIPP